MPGPIKQECPCGCGTYGTPRKKQWQDGLGGHVKGCPCKRCVGGRQRGRSRVRENKVARLTGGTREPLSGALSGVDGRSGLTVWEETANVAINRGLFKWWDGKGTQEKVHRMMLLSGVRRAFIASRPATEGPSLVVMLLEDWADLVQAGESPGG